METTTTTTTTTVLDAYFQLWNEPDADRRSELVARAFAPEGRHVDPLADVAGHAALVQLVGGVQAQFPGASLRRTTAVDEHHDALRYGWQLVGSDGAVIVDAVDVVQLAPDGRFAAVTAFFGPLSPAGAA